MADIIQFKDDDAGTYSGVSGGNREWRIIPIVTGWRLEFRDPGDQVATYAGSHKTLNAARTEAARAVSSPGGRAQHRRSRIGSLAQALMPPERDASDRPADSAPPARDGTGDEEPSRPALAQILRAWPGRRRGEDRRGRGGDRRGRVGDRRQQGDDRRSRGDDRRAPDPSLD